MARVIHRIAFVVLFLLPNGAAAYFAQDEGSEEATSPTRAESRPVAQPIADDDARALSGGPSAEVSPCRVPSAPDDEWLDKLRRGVFETVCGSARWFDQFFGDQRFDVEARNTRGHLRLLTVYDELEGFDAKVRLRAHVNLPNLDRRVNAFLGREDEDEYLRGDDHTFAEFLPDFFRDADDQDWLLGLGYSPVGSARQKFDLDAGVKVRFPLEPFVRGRYRRHWVLGEQHLVRFRETVYWRNQRGLGTSAGVDVERVVGENKLLRWEGHGTMDESTAGMEWRTGVILFQGLGNDRALAYRFAWDGETDHQVPVRSYGPQVTYRQQMFREWFFGEIVAGVTWPKEEIGQERDASFNVGFGAEIRFDYDR